MVISINCMVGLSDELVGSFVEVVFIHLVIIVKVCSRANVKYKVSNDNKTKYPLVTRRAMIQKHVYRDRND